MILNLGAEGKPLSKQAPVYSFTGTSTYKQTVADDGTVNWELALTSSGTLKFSKVVPKVDVFLVGAGEKGGTAGGNYNSCWGGTGGKGGQRVTKTGVDVAAGTNYTITIGKSSAGDTSALGQTATGGAGSRGGGYGRKNGHNRYYQYEDNDAKDGGYAFGTASTQLWPGYKYGAGGGGGSASNQYHGEASAGGGAPGTSGGGARGLATEADEKGGNATANSGSGGGGGGACCMGEYYEELGEGGAGGSGIVIIRNAR